MATSLLFNRVKVSTATTGTGTVTLGAAFSNAFCTFAEAGVANGNVITYLIEDGNDFEIGRGTYTSSGTTLSRNTVLLSKISGTSGTSKINLSGSAAVSITASKEDFDERYIPRLIASGALATVGTIDIPIDGSAWDEVEIQLINFRPATDDVDLLARVSQSGSFLSGGSDYSWGNSGAADASDAQINITGNGWGNGANETGSITVRIFRPTATSFVKSMIWHGNYFSAGASLPDDVVGGGRLLANTNAIEDVRFFFSSGNIASGYYVAIGRTYT